MANMKIGYVHPYHSEGVPIYMSYQYFMKTQFNAAGPEQVSPHYESLTRSRKGLIGMTAYLTVIAYVSNLGGVENNEWQA